MIPMGDKTVIDKFVTWRFKDDNHHEVELLVKYKHMGYIHCEWRSRQELEDYDKNMKSRMKRFLEKNPWDLNWSEDEPFNPAYIKVSFFPLCAYLFLL
jgi:hypothetical protein